ncbi:hypothetical protein [Streptomyces sp. NPDC000880]
MAGIRARILGIRVHPAAALAVSGITHYIADRRVPGGVLETIAEKTSKSSLYKLHDVAGVFAAGRRGGHSWHALP